MVCWNISRSGTRTNIGIIFCRTNLVETLYNVIGIFNKTCDHRNKIKEILDPLKGCLQSRIIITTRSEHVLDISTKFPEIWKLLLVIWILFDKEDSLVTSSPLDFIRNKLTHRSQMHGFLNLQVKQLPPLTSYCESMGTGWIRRFVGSFFQDLQVLRYWWILWYLQKWYGDKLGKMVMYTKGVDSAIKPRLLPGTDIPSTNSIYPNIPKWACGHSYFAKRIIWRGLQTFRNILPTIKWKPTVNTTTKLTVYFEYL